MNVLTPGPAMRADRAASEILQDNAHARVVAFALMPGQSIAEHRSDSTVLLHVIKGSGVFRGVDSEEILTAGQIVAYEPGELHAIRTGAEALRFVAVITPRPGG